jgi:hypothetical protein
MTAVGDTVRLVWTSDEFTRLVPGARGRVSFVDDLGTVHVEWEDGSTLGLVPGEDRWAVEERVGAS